MKRTTDKIAAKARAAKIVVSIMLLLVLVMAPVAITLSHGPGAIHLAQKADLSDQTNGHLLAEDAAGQQNTTDHEHPTVAILAGSAKSSVDLKTALLLHEVPLADGRSRDGPRRPPRDVLI